MRQMVYRTGRRVHRPARTSRRAARLLASAYSADVAGVPTPPRSSVSRSSSGATHRAFDLAAELHLTFDAVAVAYRRAMRAHGFG